MQYWFEQQLLESNQSELFGPVLFAFLAFVSNISDIRFSNSQDERGL